MDYDLIVVGGGTAGLGAARIGQWTGADTLLVSDGPPGGDCTFTGCVPSKTLLSAARAGIGFEAAMSRVASTVARVAATESSEVLRAHGIDVVEGRARLVTHDTVVVDDRRITAPRIIIATGGRPHVPPIPGLERAATYTNETLFSLSALPSRLGIVGGGPMGCEVAEAFARLGSTVSLFEQAGRLLPREEPDASAAVERVLAQLGVEVHTGAHIERIEPAGGIRTAAGLTAVDALVVAAGRTPNVEGLALDELGVEVDDRGFVQTNRRLETSVGGVFAAGDVTGLLPFTHAADEMGRIAAGNALRRMQYGGRYRTDRTPWVVFTSPEVARVGLTEAEAAQRRGRVAELPLSEVDRAVTEGMEEGFIKLIAGPRAVTGHLFGGRLLGATIVAPRAGEMINEVALMMRLGAFTGRLAQTTHAYPSWAHGLQKAAAQFVGEVEGRAARPARG